MSIEVPHLAKMPNEGIKTVGTVFRWPLCGSEDNCQYFQKGAAEVWNLEGANSLQGAQKFQSPRALGNTDYLQGLHSHVITRLSLGAYTRRTTWHTVGPRGSERDLRYGAEGRSRLLKQLVGGRGQPRYGHGTKTWGANQCHHPGSELIHFTVRTLPSLSQLERQITIEDEQCIVEQEKAKRRT